MLTWRVAWATDLGFTGVWRCRIRHYVCIWKLGVERRKCKFAGWEINAHDPRTASLPKLSVSSGLGKGQLEAITLQGQYGAGVSCRAQVCDLVCTRVQNLGLSKTEAQLSE